MHQSSPEYPVGASCFQTGGFCPRRWICHVFLWNTDDSGLFSVGPKIFFNAFHIVGWVLYWTKSFTFPPAIPWPEISAVMLYSESLTRCQKTQWHQETGPGTIWGFPGGAFQKQCFQGERTQALASKAVGLNLSSNTSHMTWTNYFVCHPRLLTNVAVMRIKQHRMCWGPSSLPSLKEFITANICWALTVCWTLC